MIFDIIFGKSFGKVHCPFHDGDHTASLNIASDGRWHCFGCGAGGPNEVSFAQQYYGIAKTSATRLVEKLNDLPRYKYDEHLTSEDIKYLTSIGISEDVQKKMMRAASGKLIYPHNYLGVEIDHTWFNYPGSTAYSAKHGKYNRDYGSVSGFLTPYKLLTKETIIIVEGEKDMLTMLSNKIPAVTVVGGCITLPYMMQRELKGKNVVIIYDCDDAGREGALNLVHWLYSIEVKSVKNVDLGLGDKEDINDWFVKYGMGRENLIKLINATPIAEDVSVGSLKVYKMYRQITKQLSVEEQEELKILLNKEAT
jgi:DNA primase